MLLCGPRDQRALRAIGALALVALGLSAHAFSVAITPGTRSLFLQVGAGTMTGGTFNNGGVPGNNTTINRATVSVPAASLGSGNALPMITDSTVTISPWDGFAYCNSPATTGQVYVGGFYRVPGTTGANATLSVTVPPNLVNGNGDTLSFGTIAWTSTGNGDTSATIPSGSFPNAGGASTLLSVGRNTWFESCLAFRYLNAQIVPAGVYTGRATYTLTAP